MEINNRGPRISPADIAALEAKLNAKLPSTYREFLSLYNGGDPTPDIVDVPDAPGMPTDVQVFFGVGRSIESSDLSWNLAMISERCHTNRVLPIACDSGGNLFCLAVEHGLATAVVYCDLDGTDCAFYPVAPSFDAFVAKLRVFHN